MILFRLIILLVPQSKLFIITTDDLPAKLRDFGSVEKLNSRLRARKKNEKTFWS